MENNPNIQIKKFVFMKLTSMILGLVLSLTVIFLILVLITVFTGEAGLDTSVIGGTTLGFIIIAALLIRLISLPFEIWRLAMIRYNFERDVLSIRGGIIARYEKNLLYSKIQHVVITQGFWERMFGISNVIIQTAGNDGLIVQQNNAQNQQLAFNQPAIPALLKEDAEKLKDEIVFKLSKFKGQGL